MLKGVVGQVLVKIYNARCLQEPVAQGRCRRAVVIAVKMSKVLIITGVSRGIGRAMVEKVFELEPETRVVGAARSEAKLQELAEQYAGRFEYVAGDLTDEQVVRSLVEKAAAVSGKIDGLIANAGVLEPVQNVNEITVDRWKKLFDVNFFSIVALTAAALPYLKKAHGNVLFVSSDASDTYFNSWGAYGSSKAAVNHFAMTLANEEHDVRAAALAPGIVDTDMQVNIRENVGPQSMSKEAWEMFTELKKSGKLVTSDVPGTVYVKLALYGIPDAANGKYLSYDSDVLKDYQL